MGGFLLFVIFILAGGFAGFVAGGIFADAFSFGERGMGITLIGTILGGILGIALAVLLIGKINKYYTENNDE